MLIAGRGKFRINDMRYEFEDMDKYKSSPVTNNVREKTRILECKPTTSKIE